MILNVFWLLLGFVMLIKGADWFVEGASKIAERMKVPQIVIGLTIVAFGTSAPEAAISISGALKGSSGIAVGNIVGSNTLNTLLILGLTALFAAVKIKKETFRYEIPFVIFISAVLLIFGIRGNIISRLNGLLFWVLFILFFVYLVYLSLQNMKQSKKKEESTLTEKDTYPRLFLTILIGITLVVLGSDKSVEGATGIAKMLGMSDRLIGLTIVSLGTSLPELLTSVSAARKGKTDIAVGNIIGSNIFNILFIVGTMSVITPIAFPNTFVIDSVVMILSVVLLYVLAGKKHCLTRAKGMILLGAYFVYCIYLFGFSATA